MPEIESELMLCGQSDWADLHDESKNRVIANLVNIPTIESQYVSCLLSRARIGRELQIVDLLVERIVISMHTGPPFLPLPLTMQFSLQGQPDLLQVALQRIWSELIQPDCWLTRPLGARLVRIVAPDYAEPVQSFILKRLAEEGRGALGACAAVLAAAPADYLLNAESFVNRLLLLAQCQSADARDELVAALLTSAVAVAPSRTAEVGSRDVEWLARAKQVRDRLPEASPASSLYIELVEIIERRVQRAYVRDVPQCEF